MVLGIVLFLFRCGQAPVQSKGVRRDVGRLTQIAPVAAVSKVRTDSVSLCNREPAQSARNIDLWYDAYSVKPDEKLYLKPEERVRIW